MSHPRRTFRIALGAFLIGGLTAGLALGIAGALPATDGGVALGALLVFPLFFMVPFAFFFMALLGRFIGGRRRWATGGPQWTHQWGDPRDRLNEWHERAHAEPETDDQNGSGEDDSRR